MHNIEEFDSNKVFPFNLGSFVGNIIVSAIAVVLFYVVILMRLDSIEHDPWWLQTINFLIVIAAGCAYFLPSYVARRFFWPSEPVVLCKNERFSMFLL